MPTISQIAKSKHVSETTAGRRMAHFTPKTKKVRQTFDRTFDGETKPFTRVVYVQDYAAADVAKAFKKVDLSTKKGIARTMADIHKMDAKQKGTKGR